METQLTQVCDICLRPISGEDAMNASERYPELCKECERLVDMGKRVTNHIKLPELAYPFKVRTRNGESVAFCPHCMANATVISYTSAGANQIICPKCGVRCLVMPNGKLYVDDLKTHRPIYLNHTPRAFENALTVGELCKQYPREPEMDYKYHVSRYEESHARKTIADSVLSKISLIQKLLDRGE